MRPCGRLVPMTVDQRLDHAILTIADRIRDELTGHLRRATADEVVRVQAEAAHMPAGLGSQLVVAFRAIDRARSLAEILQALTDAAVQFSGRAAILLPRPGELDGWRFLGFGLDDTPASSIVVPVGQAGILDEALQRGEAISEQVSESATPWFAALPTGGRRFAAPLMLSGNVVAVFYADRLAGDRTQPETTIWTDGLELLVRHAARCLEATAALRAFELTSRPVAGTYPKAVEPSA